MEPEENFDSWVSLACDLVSSLEQFQVITNSIDRIFNEISESGFLPNLINKTPEEFIRIVIDRIAFKFFNRDKLPSPDRKYILRFLTACVKISITGIVQCQACLLYPIQRLIINRDQIHMLVVNHKVYSTLCSVLLSYDAMNHILESIKYRVQTFSMLKILLGLFAKLSEHDDNFKFEEVLNTLTDSVKRILSNSNATNDMVDCLNIILDIMPKSKGDGDFFIGAVIPIVEPLLEFKNFNQRHLFYCLISTFISDKNTKKPISLFLLQHINVIKNLEFHLSYSDYVNNILSELAFLELLDQDVILSLWNIRNNYNQHVTQMEKSKFYDMFCSIVSKGKKQNISTVFDCILSVDDSEVDTEWFKCIEILIDNIRKKQNIEDEIGKIKERIWSLAFNPNINCYHKAQDVLRSVLGVTPKPEDIDRVSLTIIQKDLKDDMYLYCLSLMQRAFEAKVKLSNEIQQKLLDNIIQKICDTNPTPKQYFDLATAICQGNKNFTSVRGLERLGSCVLSNNQIYTLLNNMCFKKGIEPENLMNFATSIDPSFYNINYYKFVKKIILYKNDCLKLVSDSLNKSNLQKVPISFNEYLWDFALKPSNIQEEFIKFLCKLYASNDGEKLSDEDMISDFLNNWNERFRANDDNSSIWKIITMFISVIEDLTVTDLPQRMPNPNKIKIMVQSDENNYSLSIDGNYDTTVGYIMAEISIKRNLQRSTISLYNFEERLKPNTRVGKFVGPGVDVLYFNVKYRRKRTGIKIHERTSWPSILIAEQPWMSDIFSKLEENNEYVHQLLKKLPTLKMSINLLDFDNISKDDIPAIFDIGKPYVFVYHLTSLICLLETKPLQSSIERLTLDLFLVNSVRKIVSSQPKGKVYEDIIYEFVRFFVNYTPSDTNIYHDLIVLIIDISVLFQESSIQTYILSAIQLLFSKHKRAYSMNSEIRTRFDLLLHEDSGVREIVKKSLESVKIESQVFINFLLEKKSQITSDFLECMFWHLNDFGYVPDDMLSLSKILLDFIIEIEEKRDFSLIGLYIKIVHQMLVAKVFDAVLCPQLLKILMNLYIRFGYMPHLKKSSLLAFTCIYELSDIEVDGSLMLLEKLQEHHTGRVPFLSFASDYMSEDSIPNFGGLYNLGATCYLNSCIQQIYSIPVLRSHIINYRGEDQTLVELSKLFTDLYFSTNKVESTKLFTSKFKWYGEDLNVKDQQDAYEFIQMLVDQHMASDPTIGEISKKLMEGRSINRFQEVESSEIHDFQEQFISFGLEIGESMSSIDDCIANASSPNKQLYDNKESERRTIITELPPILILQLKRFDYDRSICRRVKIKKKLQIPLVLDISPLVSDGVNAPKYNLNGLIVHRGTSADGGHYVGYTKYDEEKWIYFNDEEVTLVGINNMIRNSTGGMPDDSCAYLLFYLSDDIDKFEVPKLDPDPEHLKHIETINSENNLKTLFFSESYTQLMNQLAFSQNERYCEVLVRYITDTLPFSPRCHESIPAVEQVVNKYSNVALKYIDIQFIQSCCFRCPCTEYRNCFCRLIENGLKALKDSTIAFSIFDTLFGLISELIYEKSNSNTVFRLLFFCVSEFEDVKSEKLGPLSERVVKFFLEDIPEYIQQKDLRSAYFFDHFDVTYALKIMTLAENVPDQLKSESFLIDISVSSASPDSVGEYMLKHFSQYQILNFLREAHDLPKSRVLILLYNTFPDICFVEFFKIPIRNHDANVDIEWERSIILGECISMYPELSEPYTTNVSQWLPRFIFYDDNNTRTNCLSIITYIIGDPCLKKFSQMAVPDSRYTQQTYIPRPESERTEISKYAEFFCKQLIGQIPELVRKTEEDIKNYRRSDDRPVRSTEIFYLLETILPLSSTEIDISPILDTNVLRVLSKSNKIIPSISSCLNILLIYNKYPKPDMLIELLGLIKGKRMSKKDLVGFCDFLIPYLQMCYTTFSNFDQNQKKEFMNMFIDNVVFTQAKIIKQAKDQIILCLNLLTDKNSEYKLVPSLHERFESTALGKKNLGIVLYVAQILNIKIDTTLYVKDYLFEEQMFDKKEMLQMLIATSPDKIDKDFLYNLFGESSLYPDEKKLIEETFLQSK